MSKGRGRRRKKSSNPARREAAPPEPKRWPRLLRLPWVTLEGLALALGLWALWPHVSFESREAVDPAHPASVPFVVRNESPIFALRRAEVVCEPLHIAAGPIEQRCAWVNTAREDAVLEPDEPLTVERHAASIPRNVRIRAWDVAVVARFETWWWPGHRFERVQRFVARQGPDGGVHFEEQPVAGSAFRQCRELRARMDKRWPRPLSEDAT